MFDLRQVVGAHQPDEGVARKAAGQRGERIGGIAGAEPALDVGDADAPVPGDGARAVEPARQLGHSGAGFQRVLRRHQPPHLVEREALERQERDVAVPVMRRIERPAEQTDAAAARRCSAVYLVHDAATLPSIDDRAIPWSGPGAILRAMDYRNHITLEPGKRGGKPSVRGMRITVYDVLGWLASGMSEEAILLDFPELTRDDIKACLAFAADRERQTISIVA